MFASQAGMCAEAIHASRPLMGRAALIYSLDFLDDAGRSMATLAVAFRSDAAAVERAAQLLWKERDFGAVEIRVGERPVGRVQRGLD